MTSLAKTVTKAFGSLVGAKQPPDIGRRGSGKKFTTTQVREGLVKYAMGRIPHAKVRSNKHPAYFSMSNPGAAYIPYTDDRFIKGTKPPDRRPATNISNIFSGRQNVPNYIYSDDPADYTMHDAVAGEIRRDGPLGGIAAGSAASEARARREFLDTFGFEPNVMYRALLQFEEQNPPQAAQETQTQTQRKSSPLDRVDAGGMEDRINVKSGGGATDVTGVASDVAGKLGPATGAGGAPPEKIVGSQSALPASRGRSRGGRRGRVKTLLSQLGGGNETFG